MATPERSRREEQTLAAAAASPPLAGAQAATTTPAELLAGYSAAAKALCRRGARPEALHHPGHEGVELLQCHGATPTGTGKHASTGKAIQPLAPAFNAERFSDPAKTEKWFRHLQRRARPRVHARREGRRAGLWLMTLK